MEIIKIFGLFVITAVSEILGCYLPFLWLKKGGSSLLLIPAAISLTIFSWLLTLHPDAAGRTYAAYGGVYVATALVWLWLVEKQAPTLRDFSGVALILTGAFLIATQRISSP